MAQGRDEAGNIWELDAQGNPVRLIQAAPQSQRQGRVYNDPYKASAEQRAGEDQAMARERLRLAQEAADRAERESALANQEKATKLEAEQSEKARLERAQAAGLSDALYQIRNTISAARTARDRSHDFFATGFGSEKAASWGGTPAADVQALLNTVGANTAFDRLTQMREESPTGGALGQVSEIELRLLRDSIASLSQSQSDKQFRDNMDKIINAYQRVGAKLQHADSYYRQTGSMEGYTPPTDEQIRGIDITATGEGITPPLAQSGATETSVPIPPEMQQEYAAYINQNWGKLDPQAYAAFREGLDRKYDFDEGQGGIYAQEAIGLNNTASQGGSPSGLAIPPVNQDLSAMDQARHDVATSPTGAFMTAMGNAGGFGIPSLFEGDRMSQLREQSPVSTFLGDVAGGITGTMGAGAILSGIGGRVANPTTANILSNPLTADIAYGTTFGATQADDPLLGAVTGAGGALAGNWLGNRLGRYIPGMTGTSRPSDPLGRGERAVLDTIQDVDPVTEALMRGEALNVPVMMVDASPELSSLAGSATRFSPTVAGDARDVLGRRNEGQIDRLAEAVERDLGPITNIPQRSEDLMTQARTQAAPLYEQAYAAPGAEDIPLTDLAERPTFAAALREAYTEILDEGLDPSAIGLQGVGDDVILASPSWQALDYTKRGLDNIIERGIRQGDAPAVRRAQQMKNALLTRMDEANPAYKQARAVYAGPAAERSFLQQGETLGNVKPDQLGVDFEGMSPEQQAQMRLGNQSEMMVRAGNLRGNSNPWAQLNTPNVEGRLGVMYPQENVSNLLGQRDLELDLAANANRLIGNSMTAERAIADEIFKQNPNNLVGDVGTGIVETAALGGPWLTAGRGIADRFMKDRRAAANLAANRELADEIGPLLFNPVPQESVGTLADISMRDAEYQDLLLQALEQAQRRGGHIGAGTVSGATGGRLPY